MPHSRHEQAAQAFRSSASYLSAVAVRKPQRWRDEEVEEIGRTALGGCIEEGGSRSKLNLLHVRRPLRQALTALPSSSYLTAVEITLELHAVSRSGAKNLLAYLAEHLVSATGPRYTDLWHVEFGAEQGENGRTLSLQFADRGATSKRPCCLVIYREQGFFPPSTLRELDRFDHAQFWKRHLQLRELPDAMFVGKRLRRLANPRKTVLVRGAEEELTSLGELVLRALELHGRVHASELVKFLRLDSAKAGLQKLDCEWLLPPPRSVFAE